MALSNTYARTSCIHLKCAGQKTISHCYLECEPRITKIDSHTCDFHLINRKIPSILFFPIHILWLDTTFLWQVKLVVVQNNSRTLFVTKQEFIWKPLWPMSTARISSQMMLLKNLVSIRIMNAIFLSSCYALQTATLYSTNVLLFLNLYYSQWITTKEKSSHFILLNIMLYLC